ncbi:MAG: glycosyltransferase [Phycisphaera sp.]|nr:MAG: glycosyltransferase [Phycisphaera sp.]
MTGTDWSSLDSGVAGTISPHTPHHDSAADLSVVVPMYREADRIGATLDDLIGFLTEWNRTSEIILVDDGSPDNTADIVTPYLTENRQGMLNCVRLVRLDRNQGKGGAVRAGLAQSGGGMILMMDADNAATIREIQKLLPALTMNTGIVAGSRALTDSDVEAVKFRALTGLVFRGALAALGMNVIRDTQCGYKLYSRDAARVLAEHSTENGYIFDLEHMLLAKRAGLGIAERGIKWHHVDGGQVSAISDGLKMLRECLRLKKKLATIETSKLRHTLAESRKPDVLVEAKPAVSVTS